MGNSIKKTVEEFINSKSRYSKFEKKTYESIFGVKSDKTKSSFINQVIRRYDINRNGIEDIKEELEVFIRDSVIGNKRNKGTAIEIYKKFLDYINSEYGLNVKISFPPIASWISLERQLYIAKKMHEDVFCVDDLADELWVSSRTIDDDLSKLKGTSDDPLQVLGQKLMIDFEKKSIRINSPSTMHPLFLTPNITQIIAMLEGLNNQRKDRMFEIYAEREAAAIWSQLSDYARKRVIDVLKSLDRDTSWYDLLEINLNGKSETQMFYSEVACSEKEGCRNILDFLKNGKTFHMEFIDNSGESKFLYECKIKKHDWQNNELIIETKGGNISISENKIIKTSEHKGDLF